MGQLQTETLSEAISRVQPGQHVIVSHAASAPQGLLKELVRQSDRFLGNPVTVWHMLPVGYTEYLSMPDKIQHVPLFIGPASRSWAHNYVPIGFSKVPDFIKQRGFDVAMVTAPRFQKGSGCLWFGAGVSGDYLMAAAQAASLVLCERSSQLPLLGWLDFTTKPVIKCETDEPIPELPFPEPGPEAAKIAEHVCSLITKGDTVQVGIGRLGGPIIKGLQQFKDLRIYSEMFLDGMEPIVLNSKRAATATFAIGTEPLYQFLRENPSEVSLERVDGVNNPTRIAATGVRSICFGAEVDMNGQVVADCPLGKQVAGIGGMIDFAIGCYMGYDARFIVALPASRIADHVVGPVAVTRELADTIVTENGIAELKGKTITERRKALERIAQ